VNSAESAVGFHRVAISGDQFNRGGSVDFGEHRRRNFQAGNSAGLSSNDVCCCHRLRRHGRFSAEVAGHGQVLLQGPANNRQILARVHQSEPSSLTMGSTKLRLA
jgi:hypothetical protein